MDRVSTAVIPDKEMGIDDNTCENIPTQSHSVRGGLSVKPESYPAKNHNKSAWQIHLSNEIQYESGGGGGGGGHTGL